MFSYLYNKYNECLKRDSKNGLVRFLDDAYAILFFYLCNTVLIQYYKITKRYYRLKVASNKPNVIVSLTSYPKRINTIWITIESLIRQAQKPDMIILWLADEQFPNRVLPETLLEQQKRGLTIRWCENLMSHKKYFYVCQEYSDAHIITADDDLIYPPFYVKRLWNMHTEYPNDVVSLTSQTIYPTYCTPPSKWTGVSRQRVISSYHISLNSGAGALFPPKSLPAQAFDKEAIQRLCPYADDLWLTAMTHMNGVKTTKYTFNPFPVVIKSTLSDSLCTNYNSATNEHPINNDTQWSAITTEYKQHLKNIIGEFFE